MDLNKMVDERLVKFDFDVSTKEEAIKKIAKLLADADKVSDLNEYIKGVFEREKEFSTGIGMGVAIPHCKSDVVKEAAFTLIKLKQEIKWESLDNQPVTYVIMLAAPNSADNVHLKMLSQLATNLMDDDFRKGLLEATSIEDINKVFTKEGE